MRKRWSALGLALACAISVTVGPSATSSAKASCGNPNHPGGEWRSYGHDFRNTRNQDQERKIGITEAPTLSVAWAFSAEAGDGKGDFTGTPVIADGCLFVGSNEGWVFAINADSGKPVWSTKVKKGGINSTVHVDAGRVFATVSRVGKPAVIALDQQTGELLWDTTIDTQPGADVYGSPIAFDGLVFAGWSGGAAELGDETDRYPFQGGFTLVDARSGRLVKKTYTIRPPDKNPNKPKDKFAGGAIWSTPAIDADAKYAYAGTGNPFRPQKEHKYTNAILKIDLDRNRPTFGEIVDHYKGTVDEYFPGVDELPCFDIPGNPPPYYPQGVGSCGDLDLDFGAAPNLFRHKGRLVVGEGQKSGIYHVANAENMKRVWTAFAGPPTAVGGIVGSTAFDGDAIYGPVTAPGYLWSLDAMSGTQRWVSPTADGAHWGNPVAYANGVVYTVDLKGFLDAYEARTGAPLLHFPMAFGAQSSDPMLSWGGVSIARNTVYAAVGITGLDNGYVVAFRPR